MGNSSALPPSQDVKWKGVEVARGAAELAHVCGPSGSFLAHAGCYRSSPEADGFQIKEDFASNGLSLI